MLALVAAAVVLPPFIPPFLLTVLMLGLVYGIMAMSLDILMGYTGMDSLGQAAFFGVAAYTVGILTARYGFGWASAVLLAVVLATITAALAGSIAVRLGGLFFLVITLAFSQVLWGISQRWGEMTGGWLGLHGIPRPLAILDRDINFYYVVLGVFLVAAFLMLRLVGSPFGLTLRGIRDSESRMKTSGYNVWLHRYMVFVICGVFAGVAGILYAFTTQFIAPVVLAISTSFDAMLMVIIGGAGTLLGPVIGAIAVVGLRNYLSGYVHHWIIILGLIYILTVFYAPKGVLGWIRDRRTRRPSPEDIPEVETKRYAVRSAPGVLEGPAAVAGDGAGTAGASIAVVRDGHKDAGGLRVEGLSKTFGHIQALRDVSISLDAGTRMAVIGPNGAGKTTLFNLISGLYRPSSGEISLFGRNITRLAPHTRNRMGLARTYQITNLYPSLSALDNIRLGLLGTRREKYSMYSRVSGLADVNGRARELLELIRLWSERDTEVRHLSYGHQRQLELVMALASEPKVLLLDEPAAGLSVAETEPMVELIRSLDPNLAILIIEHDMDVAFEIADQITVLHNGQMLARGTKEQVQANNAVRDVYFGHAYL
jgi:branched-chain amino acid transport system ATP-binding protein